MLANIFFVIIRDELKKNRENSIFSYHHDIDLTEYYDYGSRFVVKKSWIIFVEYMRVPAGKRCDHIKQAPVGNRQRLKLRYMRGSLIIYSLVVQLPYHSFTKRERVVLGRRAKRNEGKHIEKTSPASRAHTVIVSLILMATRDYSHFMSREMSKSCFPSPIFIAFIFSYSLADVYYAPAPER